MDCLFCKIINKEIPVVPVYEDNDFIVINDINPKAKTHFLFIPKRHIETINDLENEDKNLIWELFLLVKKIAKEKRIIDYRLQFNVWKGGWQEIMHIHLHFLAN